jgi:hypothetical protein
MKLRDMRSDGRASAPLDRKVGGSVDSEVEIVPLVAVFGLVGLLFVPYLNLIVLWVVLLAVVAAVVALAGALVASPYLIGRSVLRHRRARAAARDSSHQRQLTRSSGGRPEALAGPSPRPVGGSHIA